MRGLFSYYLLQKKKRKKEIRWKIYAGINKLFYWFDRSINAGQNSWAAVLAEPSIQLLVASFCVEFFFLLLILAS